MYVLLFSKARNIVFERIVISQDYSLPLSKLFCLKGSLNLKERRGNFLVVFWESCTFRMVQIHKYLCIFLIHKYLCMPVMHPYLCMLLIYKYLCMLVMHMYLVPACKRNHVACPAIVQLYNFTVHVLTQHCLLN